MHCAALNEFVTTECVRAFSLDRSNARWTDETNKTELRRSFGIRFIVANDCGCDDYILRAFRCSAHELWEKWFGKSTFRKKGLFWASAVGKKGHIHDYYYIFRLIFVFFPPLVYFLSFIAFFCVCRFSTVSKSNHRHTIYPLFFPSLFFSYHSYMNILVSTLYCCLWTMLKSINEHVSAFFLSIWIVFLFRFSFVVPFDF